MRLTNAIAKLNKLGTLNKEVTQAVFNGENDAVYLDKQNNFSIKLAKATIEFTTYKRENTVKDFTVVYANGSKDYPSTLSKAIKLAS